jgi:hypothetical protein
VVVGRSVSAPSSASAPQVGLTNAIDGLSAASPTGYWVVPPPGTQAAPAVSNAAPYQLALLNTSDSAAGYTVFAVSPYGTRAIASGTFAAGATAIVNKATLANVAFDEIIVHSTAQVAAVEDNQPSGNFGVVPMPGIPLAASISL